MQNDPEQAFRSAMGAFATGVTVVTAADGAGAVSGMTVNSLTSVALEPRLLLWCVGVGARRYKVFADADVWGVTVLGADMEKVARKYARAETQGAVKADTFAGAPVLREGLAHIACRTHLKQSAGDHLIIIGEVLDVRVRPGAALTFFRGGYGELADPSDVGS
jgi:flavin reductase (DIM6/NTAB) family NADH-FMN oxidoreductase RutF